MRKVWNTLVVLGILLCMVMSLGVTADAAEGDAAIFAVSGTQLSPESIDVMKTQCPDCLVVDVDGLADGQSGQGYNVVYTGSDPGSVYDYACVWPGCAQMFYVGTQSRTVVLVGVGEASTSDEVAGAVSAYLGDNPYVIAVGPAAAAAAVSGCADVDMFMTKDLEDTSAAGAATVVNVGKQAENPVSLVKVNSDGSASAEAIPVPQPVADPGVPPVEQTEGDQSGTENWTDPNVGPVDMPAPEEQQSVPEEQPAPEENQPAPLEEQPAPDENQPAPEEQQPAPEENQPAPEEQQPAPEEQQPAPEEAPITYCTIIYDGNGRTGGMVPDVYDFIAGSTYFMAQNGYTRDGYEFAGWKIDDGETIYQPNDEVIIDHDVTVYAQWTEIAQAPAEGEPVEGEPTEGEPTEQQPADEGGSEIVTYTVTYKPGEGQGAEQAFPYNETDSKDIVLPDGSAFTAPEGKRFCGWQLEGTADIWEGNTPYTVTASVNFVAQYKTTYTVTYDFGESPTAGYTDTVFEGESYGLAGEAVVEVPANKTFGGWMVNGELKNPGDNIVVNGDVTVTAQWNDDPASVTPVPVTEITVTYKAGFEGVEDYVINNVKANDKYTLIACPFTLPEGQVFVGWKQMSEGDESVPAAAEGEDVLAPGATVDTAESNLVFVAVTETQIQVTVTYLPDNGSDKKVEVTTDPFKSGEAVQYTLIALPEDFEVPAGKTFGGWKVGDSVLQPDDSIALKEDAQITAVWNDVAKEQVDPAVDTDSLMYTQGATDQLALSFKAKIDTVSVDGTALTLNTQYGVTEDGDTSKIFFDNTYLDSLSTGDHTVNVTFVSTDTTDYTPNTRTLSIKADPATETSTVTSVKQDWDRTQNLIIDFGQYNRGNPTKLELLRAYEKDESGNYKKDESGNYIPVWMELSKDKDYSINGTAMTFYPSLLGTWANQQYGFRVTFDGSGTDLGTNTMSLYLNVTGTAPTAQPTDTPAPTGSAGYVTGDSVNLRAGAGTDSQVLRTVAKGTKLTIYSITNGWAYVSVDGVNGYMSASYVAYENATPTATPNGPTAPPTGDDNNVILYIVILVVLIIALAVVLIVMMKRRRR